MTVPTEPRCEVHTNHYLSYWEAFLNRCLFCRPLARDEKPPWPTTGADGKPSPDALKRQRFMDYLNSLTEEERLAMKGPQPWSNRRHDDDD